MLCQHRIVLMDAVMCQQRIVLWMRSLPASRPTSNIPRRGLFALKLNCDRAPDERDVHSIRYSRS